MITKSAAVIFNPASSSANGVAFGRTGPISVVEEFSRLAVVNHPVAGIVSFRADIKYIGFQSSNLPGFRENGGAERDSVVLYREIFDCINICRAELAIKNKCVFT